jgi:hypothetical protein
MASRRSRPRRLLLPVVLAATLAIELTGLAIARTLVADAPPNASAAAPTAVSSTVSAGQRPDDRATAASTDGANLADAIRGLVGPLVRGTPSFVRGPRIDLASAARATTRLRSSPARHHTSTVRTTSATAYRGRNHVWIPSLGINRSVKAFPCSRSRPPDAGVYRWGCAGRNNIYLLSHAWSTFKPLHDAYVRGRLHKGLKVAYADGTARVHTYAVSWWRVVAPTTAASWAWASLSRPSMTLQTCVGSHSEYRLMVRLVRVG